MSRPLQHGYLDRSLYTHRIFAEKPLFAPSVISHDGYVKLYRNYPMFSYAKNIFSVKNMGVRKQRVSEKHVFVHVKNNYFDEK